VLVAGAFLLIGGIAGSDWRSGVGFTPAQPIPFSHGHHVGGLGLDCRYCHAAVELGRFAGLPPTETCMTCHSQLYTDAAMLAPLRQSLAEGRPIAWIRVVQLPDFVYFDHSIHVTKGVVCASCHGAVEKMPLMHEAKGFFMGFCLDCHRAAPTGRDITHCATCHR